MCEIFFKDCDILSSYMAFYKHISYLIVSNGDFSSLNDSFLNTT